MTERIDLNRASKESLDELDELRGHGHEIVRYREERGGFTSVEQLNEVPGLTGKIGPDTLARLEVAAS
jgi:DNA uptake protein ComE-like DNA-binding protein